MKFAIRLHSFQTPLWEQEYIDYNLIKWQLKYCLAKQEDGQSSTLTVLRRSEDSVEAFLQQQFAIILHATSDLVDKSASSSASFDPRRSARYKRCIVELSKFIVRLDLFATVNQIIVDRLVDKLTIKFAQSKAIPKTSIATSTRLLHTRPWLQSLAQLNNIINTLQTNTAAETDPNKNDTALALEITQADSIGRLPLHYAAAYGRKDDSSRMLQLLGHTPCLQPDVFGDTPLLLAVISGHASIVQLFLSKFPPRESHSPTNIGNHHNNLLALAIESGHEEVAETLIAAKLGLNFLGDRGQSPLYRAARRGCGHLVSLLLEASVDADVADFATQWTPLMVACVHGHMSPVEHLKVYGVDVNRLDRRSWSAVDHASYRGYPKIVAALQPAGLRVAKSLGTNGLQHPASGPPPPTVILDTCARDCRHCVETVMSKVFVNLGSFNLHWEHKTLDIQPYIDRLLPQVLPESSMMLELQASDCKEQYRIQLPIIGDLGNSPCLFSTATPDTMRLSFRIVRLTSLVKDTSILVCSGLVILKSLRQGLGRGRDTIGRDHLIPLVDESGTYAGELVFSFLICHPFQTDIKVPAQQKMQRLSPTVVGGHRGTGQNTKNYEHLQIGENTLDAFETATKLGAAFVEFDVQVTKDLVPVVYHDFLVSETGTDAAMYNLSISQFMELSRQQSAQLDNHPSRLPWDERARPRTQDLRRTQSLHTPRNYGTHYLYERMKHTFEYKMTGIKGNTRSSSVQEPFMTLRQLLETLPESIHLDIELKYPMLFETEDWQMDPYAMELNLFTDTILHVLFKYGRCRHIFLSSFSPELCIMLVTKQRTYPVLFLNDSNNFPTGDPRALSLQSAVHFARMWKLQGVIMSCEPFVSSPKLVKFVQGQKLFCASYGVLNDSPECAEIQAEAGIDAIIVNKVNLISKALRQ